MRKIEYDELVGERALFRGKDLEVINCHFHDGESPLKESKNIKINSSTFSYKYPLWYSKDVVVVDTLFEPIAKSGIWYTKNIYLKNCKIEAPKEFRRSSNIKLENVAFENGSETLWKCEDIDMVNVSSVGDYLLFNSKNIKVKNLKLDGNYFCDSAENVVVIDSVLNSKDAFWNCKNVYIKNSVIRGEYFGWNSENVTLENCLIESLQGFCYMKNLKMINCKLENTTLAFEYSTVDADIKSRIGSIKNPISGKIVCEGYDELIFDENKIENGEMIIEVKNV